MNFGRLIARVTIGGLFVGHGTQKLFGWFDGPGLDGASQMMDKLEMRPARRNALAASVAETAGGALLALGALTPVAASLITGTMLTAIRKVHKPQGVWAAQGGWEYNAVLIAALVALIDAGPGEVSVDAALGREEWGPGWALGGLALGAAASTAAVAIGRRAPAPGDAPPTGEVADAAEADVAGDPTTVEADDTP